MEDGTELTIQQVIGLLEASRYSMQELAKGTVEKEHEAIFSSLAGLANILAEVIRRIADIGEMAEQEDLD